MIEIRTVIAMGKRAALLTRKGHKGTSEVKDMFHLNTGMGHSCTRTVYVKTHLTETYKTYVFHSK